MAERRRDVHFYLEAEVVQAIRDRIKATPRRRGAFSAEANRLLRRALETDSAERQGRLASPILAETLDIKFGQHEAWLRPLVANASIHAAAAMLMALEAICGTRVDPREAKKFLDTIRGRAYRLVTRKGEEGAPAEGS